MEKLLEKAKEIDQRVSLAICSPNSWTIYTTKGFGVELPGNLSLGLTEQGEKNICEFFKIPTPFWGRLDLDLKATLLEGLSQKEKEPVGIYYDAEIGELVNLHERIREPLRSEKLSEIILSSLPEGWTIGDWSLSPDWCRINLLSPRQEEVRVGDLVQVGGVVTWSPIWDFSPKAKAFIYRLVCSNGMVTPTEHRFHFKAIESDAIYEYFQKMVDTTIEELENYQIKDRLSHLTECSFPPHETEGFVTRIFRHYQIPDDLRPHLLQTIFQEGDYTLWGVVNAITQYATHHLGRNDSYDLQEVAGHIAWDGTRCSRCGRAF